MSMEQIKQVCEHHIQRIGQAATQIRNSSRKLLVSSKRCERMADEAIISNSKAIGKMTEEIWDGNMSAH